MASRLKFEFQLKKTKQVEDPARRFRGELDSYIEKMNGEIGEFCEPLRDSGSESRKRVQMFSTLIQKVKEGTDSHQEYLLSEMPAVKTATVSLVSAKDMPMPGS